jgi:hypothetical protein
VGDHFFNVLNNVGRILVSPYGYDLPHVEGLQGSTSVQEFKVRVSLCVM